MELRDYQQHDWQQIQNLRREGYRKMMFRAPTGYGKTKFFEYDAIVHMSMYPESKVVVLEDSKVLINQTLESFSRDGMAGQVYPLDGDRWPSSLRGKMPWDLFPEIRVLICNSTVFHRRTMNLAKLHEMFGPYDLLITDEGHHDDAKIRESIVQSWPGLVLAVSATPWRLSDYEGFDHLYEILYVGASEQELIEAGWLSPIVIHTPDKDADVIHGGRVIAGEYNDADVMLINPKRVLVDNGINYWQTHFGQGWQTIWFCVSTEHAYQIEEELRRRGELTGGRPMVSKPPVGIGLTEHKMNMDALLAQFRAGEITHLVQVYMAKEGLDIANADVCMFLRPTLSLAVYRQAGGRITRPSAEHSQCYFVDMTASWKNPRVGMLLAPYRWSLKPRAEYFPGEAPIKFCPWHGHPNYMATHVCQNTIDDENGNPILNEDGEPDYCGYEFGKECPGCRWRPHDKWSSSMHFIELVKGEERCLMCRMATRNSLMYEITGSWDENSPQDHLAHKILYQYVTHEGAGFYIAHWVDEYGKEERREIFKHQVGHWTGSNDNDDWKHCARVLRAPLNSGQLKELEQLGALDRLIALGFLTSEQEALYKLDGTIAATIIRDDAQLIPMVTQAQYANGFNQRDNGYATRLIAEWACRVVIKVNNGVYSWSAQAVGEDSEHHRLITEVSQHAQTYASMEELLKGSYDALWMAVNMR